MSNNFEKLFPGTSKSEFKAAGDKYFGGKNSKIDNDVELMIFKKDRKKFIKKSGLSNAKGSKVWASQVIDGKRGGSWKKP